MFLVGWGRKGSLHPAAGRMCALPRSFSPDIESHIESFPDPESSLSHAGGGGVP